MNHLLVVDDDPLLRVMLGDCFSGPGYSVRAVSTAAEGLAAFKALRADVVLIDVRLPDMSGLELFQKLHALDGTVPMIFITASDASDLAIEATKLGSFDYLVKPLNLKQVFDLVKRALHLRRLMSVPVAVDENAGQSSPVRDAFVGRCPAMREVYKAIGRVAPHDVNVLIRGASGTGKELVARAIYQHSRRSSKAFMAINCAAIPEALLESELFGHEKGSFTGADRQRIGKFEQISGGTLFLDEIGDMPLALQAKILRVLQDQQFQRVGGSETISTDVRIIAATHRNLEQAIAAERFRGDLFYRLNGFSIDLPPLRERTEDLPMLVEHFLRRHGQELNKEVHQVAPGVMEVLLRHTWPGNVRELQSVLQQAILQSAGPIILMEDLPRFLRSAALPDETVRAGANGADGSENLDLEHFVEHALKDTHPELYARSLERLERYLITRVLRQTGGHQTKAAEMLGITRGSLRNKIRTLGLRVVGLADEPDGDLG
jgi:nitrogen regulation protein NR(I)